ncbi:hypothetical protein LAZ67_7000662 [Cordylochernes scorpioides]|uniref:Uncharacterized protein n=1 Tax=Cordylochernes scorpioides TaxID=51811 RepID=A0ABY6KPK4_9ARAC|nr:hypothetical protein LAZ67_7000662 [Cordylochernes scorpioides]
MNPRATRRTALPRQNCPPVHNDLCFSTSEDIKSDAEHQFRHVNQPFPPNSGFVEEEGKILRDHPPTPAEKQRRSPSPIIIDDVGGNSNPPPATKRHCPEGGSQLREMLQNPGLPKETRARSNSFSIGCGNYTQKNPESINGESPVHMSRTKIEEVYKFKNNIKHRFNADLQQTSTPSTPTPECTNGGASTDEIAPDQRGFENFQRDPEVKVPPEHRPGKPETWEPHHEYSCGSNPSPTLGVTRSNGSSTSSGYSTGGEGPAISKLRFHLQGQQSPVPPQSSTPENLSTPSSSPQQIVPITAVPIFALHPKGTYYIPLTIDMALLNPYLHGYEDPFPILHPVNISVNFTLGRPVKVLDRSNVGGIWPGHAFSIEKLGCVFVDRNAPPHQQPHPYPNGTPAAIR